LSIVFSCRWRRSDEGFDIEYRVSADGAGFLIVLRIFAESAGDLDFGF